jgi:signal transduction histidine kinase
VSAVAIAVQRDFQGDLPFCMADRKRLHRCLSNLVSNAIQAMPTGGQLTVATALVETTFPAWRPPETKPEPAIRVTVRDTGQGIPPDRLPRIFDPFYTTKEKGVGLGMAITHRIVEDHKGTIDVSSEVGKGSTFTVHFPLSG